MNVVELCAKQGLNPKVVRAKLRRALKAGTLKMKHEERATWEATPAVVSFLKSEPTRAAAKPAKGKAATKSKRKPMTAEQKQAFKDRMAASRKSKAA